MLKTHNPDQNGRPSTGVPAPQRARASWTGILQLSLLAMHVLHDFPDTPEKAARSFDALPHRIMITGHLHRWLIATPRAIPSKRISCSQPSPKSYS